MTGNLHDSIRRLEALAKDARPSADRLQEVDTILDSFSAANKRSDAYVSEKIEEIRSGFAGLGGEEEIRDAIYKLSRLVSADGKGMASQDTWSLRNFF